MPVGAPGGAAGDVATGMTGRRRGNVGGRPAGRPSPTSNPLPQVTSRLLTGEGRDGGSRWSQSNNYDNINNPQSLPAAPGRHVPTFMYFL